ncbi:hypothetical protein TRFO_27298 [Tritrichomonas foetus]|uniref:DUF3447 domain-containing protein n=1 Tax=Tritrichomonas foetus TaxID=1144522 RepID=A0A1J4K1K1_9EUKA|nr:hypothetical protein TRFO_27298 [Tritrichomonas foetus]|eukprot:OHT05115.1 hypothetical protein TRFO_27298 [Tritrichomonas foetus]
MEKEVAEFYGLNEFLKRIDTLGILQKSLVSIFEGNEDEINGKITTFFISLSEFHIESSFSLYEAFLYMLSNVYTIFLTKNSQNNPKYEFIFKSIIDELNQHHSLKTTFHESTIFLIFETNRLLLLYLYEKHVIDLSTIRDFINIRASRNNQYILFFIPELMKDDSHFMESININLSKEYILKSYLANELTFEELSEKRKELHSNEEIARIIRKDDLDSFINYISHFDKFYINSKIQSSFLEMDPLINNYGKGVSLIEYSMCFGSINIFKYLFTNQADMNKNSLNYSVIGGNYEIIEILVNDSEFKFTDFNLFAGIKYIRPDITEYLMNILQMQSLNLGQFFFGLGNTHNFDYFNQNIKTFLSDSNNASPIGSIYDEIVYYTLQMSGLKMYMFYEIILQNPKLDINQTNKIFSF